MPRLPASRDAYRWLAGVCVALACGPEALHAALAAAAGTMFEAGPFLLAAELLPRLGIAAVALGCGCGRRAPGALSLPATALCWIAFGPLPALSRLALAVLLLVGRRRSGKRANAPAPRSHSGQATSVDARDDVFAELLALAASAALTVTATSALRTGGQHLEASTAGRIALAVAGAALGSIAPCATAGVALAAALAATLPSAAHAVLFTAGLLRLGRTGRQPSASTPRMLFLATPSRLAVALAFALLVMLGGHGFLNPRLLPFAAAGALVALFGARRSTESRYAGLVPALLLAGLIVGSPPPPSEANATRLDDAYPGQRLTFVGRAHVSDGATILERGIITCCRADASMTGVRTATRLPVASGTWIEAVGRLVATPEGLELAPARWRTVAAPADPFVYR